jgi:hypothetical protein
MLDFLTLQDAFPPGSIEFVGNNQVKLNFNALTSKSLELNSPAVSAIALLLQRLVELTDSINAERAEASPPQPPITFVSKTVVGTPSAPIFRFTVDLVVDQSALFDNLIDPTV